jgi:hypothetical protein
VSRVGIHQVIDLFLGEEPQRFKELVPLLRGSTLKISCFDCKATILGFHLCLFGGGISI